MAHSEQGAPARARLIGAFRLAGADGRIAAIPARRGRALLAYLALAPDRSASRERLAGLLWSDRGEAQARASLRQCLLDLRGSLAAAGLDLLEIGREQVALKAGALVSDLGDVERALSAEATARAAGAIDALGRGRLLEDLELGGLFGDWLAQERVRVEQSLAAAALARLGRLEAQGDWTGVRALAQAWLNREPLDEGVAAAAIRADIALGDTSGAHRRFQILQAALDRELGIAPGPAARLALKGDGGGGATQAPTAPEPGLAESAAPLVVVAAFAADAGGETEKALAATVCEEVLSGLSRFRDLRVVADPRTLERLGADPAAASAGAYGLGGSLRASAGKRRLIAQLLDGRHRRLIWSDRFDLPEVSPGAAIDDIVAQVVGAVLPTINAEIARSPGQLTTGGAYRRYVIAREAATNARTFAEARAAAAELEAMVEAEPAFAPLRLPLVYLYNNDFGFTRAGSSGPKEKARAFELAKSALALDRGHVHAYTVTGWCHLRRRQWTAAEAHFEQALELNPFHASRVMEAAFGLLFLGQIERARALLDRCLLLNPTPDDDFFQDLGLLEMMRGAHDLAASYLDLIARPRIWGLVYAAMNARLGGLPAKEKTDRARSAIAAIWPADAAAGAEAVIAWIGEHHPFKAAEMERRFLEAARATLDGA